MTIRQTLLSELQRDEEGDFFALLTAKEELATRLGKPYFRVAFRDAGREVSFPIWQDSPWFVPCQNEWAVGEFFKLRAFYRESDYGPQLDIHKIRHVTDADHEDGFDPTMCRPRSQFDSVEMFDALIATLEDNVEDACVRELATGILNANREALLTLPAAKRNHHAYTGGWLEHVLSVTRTACYLAEKYAAYYSTMDPPLDTDLIIAGAVLHDIGKLRELEETPAGAEYTASGTLIGHILQGRDMLREAAAGSEIAPDKLIRLEHIIVSHQRLPEWGSPKAPMTPEAMIIHYADDLDAKLHIMIAAMAEATGDDLFTSRQNPLRLTIYRGEPTGDSGP